MSGGVMREEIERLAYQLWLERGRPEGTPDEDWLRAERLLRFSQTVKKSRDPEFGDGPAHERVPESDLQTPEIVSGAPYVRPQRRNGGSRRNARA
jgi:hypothetical protein